MFGLELQVFCLQHAATARKPQAIPASLTVKASALQELLLKDREMNRHPNADSASQWSCISPRQHADVHSGFCGCRFVSSSKVGGTAFTPKPWGALAKQQVVSTTNMQLLVTRLGRHVWPCSQSG